MSGHSKWATTKHRKAAQDAKRSALFSKLARNITVAAKEGGDPNPDNNASLAAAIEKAKGYSMPKDKIKTAIDKAFGSGKDAANYETVVYEGYGPAGVAVLCEALTDNRNRTAADVRAAGLASAFASPAGLLRSRMEAVLAPQKRTARQFMAVALCTAAAVLAAGLTACAADGAAERVSGSLPKPQTAEPAGTGEEALKMRTALPESSAPEPSEGVLTFETSRPPVWPVPEYEYIGTQFGAGHRGTDIAAREGAEILAVWDGTVLEAEYHENWGDYVLLDHGGGIITRYAHCSELLVQPGDTVKAGEAVARVGNTGVASGNHCHLELERNGVLLDPMQKLSAPRDETPRTQARQPEPQNTETWLPPDNELIKERLAGTTGVWPVPEYTFVSRSVGRYHRGVDITAKKGADIVAPFSGTVTRAEDGEETQYWVYGKYVEIALDGDPGVRVRLTHCSELLVQPGDTVRAGQLVARVGSTGNSTGNHCHLELLADEYYTDPELILTRPEP